MVKYTYIENKIILQFGKLDSNTYSMDAQYPLSPYQCFAICLSSIATKFMCE